MLTHLHLFEIYSWLLRTGTTKSDNIIEQLSRKCVTYTIYHLKLAVLLKHKYSREKLSMADCIGYIVALSLQIKFLTGDNAFADLNNVEFVK